MNISIALLALVALITIAATHNDISYQEPPTSNGHSGRYNETF
ncbi:MAG: hypothetical protein ACJ71P_01710 [Nitrososphaeraceae archaeon]